MASTCASALFLSALLLFTAHGHGAILPGLNVNGRLCCTSTGNCPGLGINGTVVRLNCTNLLGVNTTVGQSTTDTTGSFNITIRGLLGFLLGLPRIPCVVTVQLPLNSTVCPVLSATTGLLVSTIRIVGPVVNTTAGRIINTTIDGFFRVSV